MPSCDHVTPASPSSWNEAESFRETMLAFIDGADEREAIREAGRVLYDLAVEASSGISERGSATRAELRAAQADLRYLHGYIESIGQEGEVSSLSADDEALSRFASRLAGQLGNLVAAIERTLS
jgi:hypothetical protein